MKTWTVVVLILLLILFVAVATVPGLAVQTSQRAAVPKYDPAAESTFKGTVEEVRDRVCPVAGGMGAHLILKLADGKSIEVHLAASQYVKTYELIINKGDQVEITGSKVKFEGVDTIFAREIKRGNETLVFRDKEGKPAW